MPNDPPERIDARGNEGEAATAAELAGRLRRGLSDRYHVYDAIGAGGMAVVFRATDRRHGRPVALKVMRPEVVESSASARFLREIKMAAGLQHPHLLPLHDSGEVAGLLYYVMPFVEGETLRDRLDRERQLPVQEALRIALEVADGLGHAHENGLVHRDVKPANIMLSDEHAVVADFGIARATDEAAGDRLTSTGLALGTPAYMSPEQWEAKGPVDGRTDQYALGCVLFEMLVGEPPFTGPTPQVILARHAVEEVPAIATARRGVPRGVDGVVRRAMSKVPGDRYRGMSEFSEALTAAAGGAITEPGLIPGAARRTARRPRTIGLAAAVLLLVAVAGFFLRGLFSGASIPRDGGVVVGYFQDLTGDPAFASLGNIAIDRITEGLLGARAFDVVPTPTALQASRYVEGEVERDGRVDPVRALAAEAAARVVVTGSYRVSAAEGIVLSVTISDAAASDGTLIQTFEESAPPDDPMAAVEAASGRVRSTLLIEQDERLELTRAPSYEAYLAFSRGLEAYIDRRFGEAVPELLRAAEIDSGYAVPLVYAGLSYLNLGERHRADSIVTRLETGGGTMSRYHEHWLAYLDAQLDGRRDDALEAMRRAVAVAPGSKALYNLAYVALQVNRPAEALAALDQLDGNRGPMRGWFPYWYQRTLANHRLERYGAELRDARRARELFSGARFPRQLVATALIARGDTSRAIALADSVRNLRLQSDPLRPVVPGSMYHELGNELRFHGYPATARSFFAKALDWYEGWAATYPDSARGPAHRSQLAVVLHDAGRYTEAREIVEELARESGDPRMLGWLGILLAAEGREEEARAIDAELAGVRPPYDYGRIPMARARLAAHLGDLDRAIVLLLDAFDEGHPVPDHPDSNFQAFWDDPRLAEVFDPVAG